MFCCYIRVMLIFLQVKVHSAMTHRSLPLRRSASCTRYAYTATLLTELVMLSICLQINPFSQQTVTTHSSLPGLRPQCLLPQVIIHSNTTNGISYDIYLLTGQSLHQQTLMTDSSLHPQCLLHQVCIYIYV